MRTIARPRGGEAWAPPRPTGNWLDLLRARMPGQGLPPVWDSLGPDRRADGWAASRRCGVAGAGAAERVMGACTADRVWLSRPAPGHPVRPPIRPGLLTDRATAPTTGRPRGTGGRPTRHRPTRPRSDAGAQAPGKDCRRGPPGSPVAASWRSDTPRQVLVPPADVHPVPGTPGPHPPR
ncbi:conserved hypothetical protein [Streptomyces sviceus ATCC 29083]|uniref:Uncharacterized protein n=1 Tax=Streptomyces sviceus (strain ATCC 29083 / DSM 924 / JCM 4929 / NBRC 13980 / NCIMB 11184 / NRRL 5439 / UC 5370) TaxID=463191 RepID=B5I050_STRX2|nr:conserved hypothetical protein [Streptomyces sviceus ATCC 29083]